MTVPLTGTAGFFTRQGAIIGEFNRVTLLYGSALTNGFQSIWAQFASSDQQAVQNLPDAVTAYRTSQQQYLNTLIGDGQLAAVLQVNDDSPLVPYTLQEAFTVLASQMKTAVASIQRPTLTNTVTPGGSNLGDTTVVTSTTNPFGDPLDMTFGETVTTTCTFANTAYQETLNAVGQPVYAPSDYRWPGGSGANATFSVTDQAVTGIVTDGGFELWHGTGNNTPDDWDLVNGAPGVTVFRGTGGVRGNFVAEIHSDGASATQLSQDITTSMSPNVVYAVCVFVKINTLDASGTFRIALTDQDGNVINNDAGTPLSFTRNFNGQVTASYAILTAFFSTPRQLPVTVNVQVGCSVAPTSGRVVSLDLLAVRAATQLYNGGPYIAAFAGANRTAVGDTYACAFTNSLTSKSFARGLDRLYSMRDMGVYLPSALSPTVSDSLVTN